MVWGGLEVFWGGLGCFHGPVITPYLIIDAVSGMRERSDRVLDRGVAG